MRVNFMDNKNSLSVNTGFDWSVFENGYNGQNLCTNKHITGVRTGDKVFCHESYAQEVYDKYFGDGTNNAELSSAKDEIVGAIYKVTDIFAVSNHEVSINTDCGLTAIVDILKEKPYLEAMGVYNVEEFCNGICYVKGYKETLLESGMRAQVLPGGRISLWEGHLSKIRNEFLEQVNNPHVAPAAYNAFVEEVNGGGYIVDIMGVKCFMPGSLAAAGILSDFNVLLGKTIPVMIVNFLPNSGFVVSYKKYLNFILPGKIENELYPGLAIYSKVTGTSKNGIFVQFKDVNGEYIFSGLIHRSVMSPDFEKRFDRREFRIGDEFKAYINNINKTGKDQYRIVVSDEPPVIDDDEEESEE